MKATKMYCRLFIFKYTLYFLLAFYRYFGETLDSVIFLRPRWQPWVWALFCFSYFFRAWKKWKLFDLPSSVLEIVRVNVWKRFRLPFSWSKIVSSDIYLQWEQVEHDEAILIISSNSSSSPQAPSKHQTVPWVLSENIHRFDRRSNILWR